ncbi:MAG: hypothetical protein C9356_06420 [Oleiphilus sp.]|nr:MAG: hypothetical protein C9356_06420 [Oleiphilus sp.]
MNAGHGDGSLNFLICILLALTLHICALVVVSQFITINLEDTRTVPVITLSNATTQQALDAQGKPVEVNRELIDTTGRSTYSTHQPPESPPENPSLPSTSPSVTQNYRQRLPSTGFQNLFSREETELAETVQQISTRNTEILSSYQLTLRKHMLKGELYDRFHRYLRDHDKPKINYEILLTLFPNGAIKNASIRQSSGVEELDKLAITAAFNASPYPAPPTSDIRNGFRYAIPFTYVNAN